METDVRMNADIVSMDYNVTMKRERVYMDVIQGSNKKNVKNNVTKDSMVKNVKKNVVTAGIQISALLLMGNASQDVKQVTRMYTVKHNALHGSMGRTVS